MQVEKYKIKGWKKRERGLLISENDHWILVKHIPVDYILDGYKLYSKKHIKQRQSKSKEKQIERVLRLKNVNSQEPEDFKFGETIEILKWVENKFGLFEFQDDIENELHYGSINKIEGEFLNINMIRSNGTIEEEFDCEFKINEIRTITFMTDYFESIRLLMNDELKKKYNR